MFLKYFTIEINYIVKKTLDTTCFCRLGSLEVSLATLHATLPHYTFLGNHFSVSLCLCTTSLQFAFPALLSYNQHNT